MRLSTGTTKVEDDSYIVADIDCGISNAADSRAARFRDFASAVYGHQVGRCLINFKSMGLRSVWSTRHWVAYRAVLADER